MPTSLFRLVYRSDSTIGGTPATVRAQLDQIVRSSQCNNAASEITGALFAGAGCFAQVLEGPLSAVESTYERIGRDQRHGTIMLLDIGAVEQRAFKDWSMTLVEGRDDALPRFTEVAGTAASKAAADRIIQLLHAAIVAPL